MVISKRIVDPRRHTVGFVIQGKQYTRDQAAKLVRSGQLRNARIVRSKRHGTHLMGTNGTRLYSLPVVVAR